MKIVQLLPELNEGGVERGVVELNREFVQRGMTSVVISRGGRLVKEIEAAGGIHVLFDVCSKNPFSVPMRVRGLKKIFRRLDPDILHARSRVPAWLTYLANRRLRYPFVTTVHGLNSVNKYSEIMTRGDRVITIAHTEELSRSRGEGPVQRRWTGILVRMLDRSSFSSSSEHACRTSTWSRALVGSPAERLQTFIRRWPFSKRFHLVGLIVSRTGDKQITLRDLARWRATGRRRTDPLRRQPSKIADHARAICS
jgi:hypothetical protein